jgi:hypothetical protein
VTSLDFAVGDLSLRMDAITAMLAVSPTEAFDEGDIYEGRERRDGIIVPVSRTHHTGVWHYGTEHFVQSDSLDDHLRHFLAVFEPASAPIARLAAVPGSFGRDLILVCR